MPFRSVAAAVALLWSTTAPAAWHVAESEHFVVYANDSAADTREYAQELETFDAAVRLTVNLPDRPISPSNRVTVFLVDDLADVRKLAGAGQNSGLAGFYAGRASGSFAFAPRSTGNGGQFALSPRQVLQHEYAHHLMLANYTGAFPAWLIEGWAEFFGTARAERDGSVTVGAPPLYRAYGLANGKPLTLSDMVSGSYDELRGDQLEALYGRGWALTHLLMFESVKGGPRAGQLNAYLRALGGGADGMAAATGAFGDLRVLDREVDRMLNARRMVSLRYTPEMIRTEPVSVRPLSAGEAAILPIRMRSKRGVDEAEAKAVLNDARRVAATHTDDPLVWATLAEAEFDAGNLEPALAAARRTVALDPKSVEGHIYQARARLAMLRESGGDATAWAAARQPLLAANAIENDDAEPLMLYYQSFPMADQRPTANAVAALMQSQALAPQDSGLRLTATRQLLIDGDAKAARRMAAPLAFNPHAAGLSKLTRELVTRLDAAGTAAALAFMDESRADAEAADDAEE